MATTLNDVPQAGQSLALTQPQIRTNFSTISTAFAVDHVPFNAVGQGWHNQTTFPVQASAASFASGQVGLYNLNYAGTGRNELFLTNSQNVSFPITASAQSTSQDWSYLPSGRLMKWGTTSSSAPGSNIDITLSQGPAFNQVIMVQLTSQTPNLYYTYTTGGPSNGFRMNITLLSGSFTGTASFQYLAIGF